MCSKTSPLVVLVDVVVVDQEVRTKTRLASSVRRVWASSLHLNPQSVYRIESGHYNPCDAKRVHG